jgi:hypothetical protein
MKTITLAFLLLMFTVPCRPESYDEYLVRINKESPKSNYTGESVIKLLAGMTTPKMNGIYDLTYMQIVQKVKGGYLMVYMNPAMNNEPCFLKTNKVYKQNDLFREGERAELTGLYTYTAINGFEDEVIAFKEVE